MGDSVVVGIAARSTRSRTSPPRSGALPRPIGTCPICGCSSPATASRCPCSRGSPPSWGWSGRCASPDGSADTDSFYHAIDINTSPPVRDLSLLPHRGARASLPTIASRVGGVPTSLTTASMALCSGGRRGYPGPPPDYSGPGPHPPPPPGAAPASAGREDFSLRAPSSASSTSMRPFSAARAARRPPGRRPGLRRLRPGQRRRRRHPGGHCHRAAADRPGPPHLGALPQPGRHPPHLPGQLHLHLCLPPAFCGGCARPTSTSTAAAP